VFSVYGEGHVIEVVQYVEAEIDSMELLTLIFLTRFPRTTLACPTSAAMKLHMINFAALGYMSALSIKFSKSMRTSVDQEHFQEITLDNAQS
jgi:hypothetical protein